MQAFLRFLCSFSLLLLCSGILQAESFKGPSCEGHAPIRSLSQEEAAHFLKEFRSLNAQSYAVLLQFTQSLKGKAATQEEAWFYKFQNPQGETQWRLYFPETGKDFLLQESLQVSYNSGTSTEFISLPLEDIFEPLSASNGYSLYDLSLLFLHWPSAYYERSSRVLGRKAHIFVRYPPPNVSGLIGAIRVYLDAHFFALLKADFLDARGEKCLQSLQVLSFQKLSDGSYGAKTLELKNLATHTKTRCTIQAFGWELPPATTLEDLSHPPPFLF